MENYQSRMINIWKQEIEKIQKLDNFEKNCWIDVSSPTMSEIDKLKVDFDIPSWFLEDILDIDERSRLEIDDKWTMILLRIPVHNSEIFYTIPLGILISEDCMITVCDDENMIISDIIDGKVKGLKLNDRQNFILNILNLASLYYMRFTKIIVRNTTKVEKNIEKSIENSELNALVKIQKCLVYFTTSIRNNEILLDRLRRSYKNIGIETLDEDLVEDVLIETRQAYEMTKIHSEILTGMMDAFASIISNNLNVVMKQLTIVTLVFMPLNIISGMGGMSEFSTWTTGVPWGISYGLFTVGMFLVGYLTFVIIKRMLYKID